MSVSEPTPAVDVSVSLPVEETAPVNVMTNDDESLVAARKQGDFSTLFHPVLS